MKKSFTRIFALFCMLVMVLGLAACGGSKTDAGASPSSSTQGATASPETQTAEPTGDAGEPQYGGTFSAGKAASCRGLTQLYGHALVDQFAFPAVETLGRWDYEAQEFKPFLAESWEHDYDANTFTINLREGVNFSDGTVFDAEALKWNLDTWVAHRGASSLGNPTEFEVKDDLTLVIHFDAPSFSWESIYALVMIYSPTSLEENGEDWGATNCVGTGPFVLDSFTPDQSIIYTRNDNYWQEGLPYLDTYRIMIITDWAAMEAAFINGDVDYYNCADLTTAQELINMGYPNAAVDYPDNYTTFTALINNSIEDDPFYDIRVRQAVMYYGVDWAAVGYASRGDFAVPLGQFLTNGSWGYIDDYWLDQNTVDVDKAKELLTEAGYPNGFDTQISCSNVFQTMATAIQAELQKIGINAEVNLVDNAMSALKDNTLPGMQLYFWMNKTDATNALLTSYYPGYYDMINYSDEYVAAIDASAAALTQEERASTQQEALKILYEDMCVTRAYFTQPSYTVLTEGAMDTLAEYKAYLPELVWWNK